MIKNFELLIQVQFPVQKPHQDINVAPAHDAYHPLSIRRRADVSSKLTDSTVLRVTADRSPEFVMKRDSGGESCGIHAVRSLLFTRDIKIVTNR